MRWILAAWALVVSGLAAEVAAPGPVKSLKVTILSTMLAERGLGEWGFAALVEVDGHRILFDTGMHPDLVLKNAATLGLDLADVPDVILSHSHFDHTGGLMTLRESVRKKNPAALATVHGAEGLLFRRVAGPPAIIANPLLANRAGYEATRGVFRIHAQPVQLHPGVWFTGPVPRTHPERNYPSGGKLEGPAGVVADNVPEDAALVIDTVAGLVVITGCGHAGVVNIVEHARAVARPANVHALIGGMHLFNATDEALAWTAGKLRGFGVEYLIGAHCTGVETVFRFRGELGLDRTRAVIGATGMVFELGKGVGGQVVLPR